MKSEAEFLAFAAGIFHVPVETLSLETTYQSIPEWDSMAQLRLVMELSSREGLEIPFADVPRVTSLWEFYRRLTRGPVKKAVAVDLDGTLWDGVIGEDGPTGIRPHLAFQRELKALKGRGVLLVALSKNNFEDVSFAGMEIGPDDFVAMALDWNAKPANLARLAAALNLGTDAFVFVDDNPVERAQMRASLPEVTVAEFPPCLAAYFPERTLTDEDRTKTEQYRAEAGRRAFAVGRSAEDWLAGLGIRVDIHPLRSDEIVRVAQLSQKANQFNVTTSRFSENDVRAMSEDPDSLILVAHAGDRFGEQGLVAFVVAKGGDIVDFTLSCRAAGRRIEDRLIGALLAELKNRGVTRVTAAWLRTAKNAPVRDLFDRLGFSPVEATDSLRRYERVLA